MPEDGSKDLRTTTASPDRFLRTVMSCSNVRGTARSTHVTDRHVR